MIGLPELVMFSDDTYGIRRALMSYDHGRYRDYHYEYLDVFSAPVCAQWHANGGETFVTICKNKSREAVERALKAYEDYQQRVNDNGTVVKA